ncbi:hypothetical protein FQA39_LY03963 [Lamprigera yunnana]|nr:hypothetical protein FQA39_LY03963 [Lamprigera yunnana]
MDGSSSDDELALTTLLLNEEKAEKIYVTGALLRQTTPRGASHAANERKGIVRVHENRKNERASPNERKMCARWKRDETDWVRKKECGLEKHWSSAVVQKPMLELNCGTDCSYNQSTKNIYSSATMYMKIDSNITTDDIPRGVKRGDVISLKLFISMLDKDINIERVNLLCRTAYSGSRSITQVKQHRARLTLGWMGNHLRAPHAVVNVPPRLASVEDYG